MTHVSGFKFMTKEAKKLEKEQKNQGPWKNEVI